MHMYIGGAEIAFGRPSCSLSEIGRMHYTLRSVLTGYPILRSVHQVVCAVNSDVANCLTGFTNTLKLRKQRTLALSLRFILLTLPSKQYSLSKAKWINFIK